jgi:hypothetical protein
MILAWMTVIGVLGVVGGWGLFGVVGSLSPSGRTLAVIAAELGVVALCLPAFAWMKCREGGRPGR